MSDYEFTPTESAERLLGFIGDFSDDKKELLNEVYIVANAFRKMRDAGGELEILSHHLDIMLMDQQFKDGKDWLKGGK